MTQIKAARGQSGIPPGYTCEWLCFGVLVAVTVTHPFPACGVILLALAGHEVLLHRMPLPTNVVVGGYWMYLPRRCTWLHFVPPRELRQIRRKLGPSEAMRRLRSLLEGLDAHGVHTLWAATNLPGMRRLGFRRVAPASPLSWIAIVQQHHAATGKWRLNLPWIHVYDRIAHDPALADDTRAAHHPAGLQPASAEGFTRSDNTLRRGMPLWLFLWSTPDLAGARLFQDIKRNHLYNTCHSQCSQLT